MRIAVNARLLANQKLEGMGLYIVEVVRQLLRNTDHEFLLLTDRPGALPDFPRPVERVIASPPARHPVLFYAWFEWAVPRALRKWRADAFLSLENFCSLRTTVPTLLVIHDLAYRHLPEGVSAVQLAYYRRYMPRFARRADALLTVSEATRRDVSEAYGIPEDEIGVAYNGVRGKFRRLSPKQVSSVRERFTQGQPYFIYVGSVHPRKNVHGLIRAFDRFKSETGLPHRLVIAGRIAWKAGETTDALHASPYREHIVLPGYVEEAQLGELIGAATALALVSFFEGFGVPVIEAFNCGVPAVVSDRSSLPEVAGPGGLLVDPNDTRDITAALTKLATDSDARQVLAKAGETHAAQFTWQRTGRQISEALRGLAPNH